MLHLGRRQGTDCLFGLAFHVERCLIRRLLFRLELEDDRSPRFYSEDALQAPHINLFHRSHCSLCLEEETPVPSGVTMSTTPGSNGSRGSRSGQNKKRSLDLTDDPSDSPCAKWDAIISPLKSGKGKWHPKTVPTLRGEKKGAGAGICFRAAHMLDVYNTLAGQARKRVLGRVDDEFPNHNEAVCVFCLLMEHTHSKFRSSHRCPALLIVCAEIRKTYNELNDDIVKKKLADLEAEFQTVVDTLT